MVGIKSYILNKLIFPKIIVMDSPGIIISRATRKYGKPLSQKRMVYYFEDIFTHLQNEAIKKLGREKVSELYYRIGKDTGLRHTKFATDKKPPSFLINDIIHYIAKGLHSSGLSAFKHVNINNKSITFRGKNNIICRKTGEASVFAGFISGVLCQVYKNNVESEMRCTECPNNCEIFVKESSPMYIPPLDKITPHPNYNKYNFPKNIKPREKALSYKDLLKFNKTKILDGGKWLFFNKTIIPAEIGMMGLIVKNFEEFGSTDILKKGLVSGAVSIFNEILNDCTTIEKKLVKLQTILCIMGWGYPLFSRKSKSIEFIFNHPPFNKHGFNYQAYVLRGALQSIFKRDVILKSVDIQPNKIIIKYSVN